MRLPTCHTSRQAKASSAAVAAAVRSQPAVPARLSTQRLRSAGVRLAAWRRANLHNLQMERCQVKGHRPADNLSLQHAASLAAAASLPGRRCLGTTRHRSQASWGRPGRAQACRFPASHFSLPTTAAAGALSDSELPGTRAPLAGSQGQGGEQEAKADRRPAAQGQAGVQGPRKGGLQGGGGGREGKVGAAWAGWPQEHVGGTGQAAASVRTTAASRAWQWPLGSAASPTCPHLQPLDAGGEVQRSGRQCGQLCSEPLQEPLCL